MQVAKIAIDVQKRRANVAAHLVGLPYGSGNREMRPTEAWRLLAAMAITQSQADVNYRAI